MIRTLRPNMGKGKSVTICGAGPSLSSADLPLTTHVWATNSALSWMQDNGKRVTHGIGIDFGADLVDDWKNPPDVVYYLASSVHPDVVKHLLKHKRKLRWFHNYCGMPGELELYESKEVPANMLAVTGAPNSANRCVILALALGYEKVYLAGADCCLSGDEFYADGRTIPGQNPLIVETELDGKVWKSSLELFLSAVNLVHLQKACGERLVQLGDTFPKALLRQGPEFLANLPKFTDGKTIEGFYAKVETLS